MAAAAPVLLVALGAPVPALFGAASDPLAAPPLPPRLTAPPTPPRIGFLDVRESGLVPAGADRARVANARVAFARVPARAAPPFFISGALADRARAADCLAAAGYYEAGDDLRGQRAVMQVVLNRLRNPAYPGSVCGVVFQGSERSTGCQFTFTCDGAMTRYRPSPAAWARARGTAIEALNGFTDATVGHATHYHTDWVHPYWSATLDKIAAVDTHLFFQASAERPGNFSSPYAGAEPRVGRLAWLSAAHGGAGLPAAPTPVEIAALPPVAIAPPPPPPSGPPVERLPDKAAAPSDGIFLVMLDPGADPNSFRALAKTRCGALSQCKFIGWTDPARRAHQFPLPGSAIDAIAFSFNRTGAGAADTAQWDCRQFARPNPAECLRRGATS